MKRSVKQSSNLLYLADSLNAESAGMQFMANKFLLFYHHAVENVNHQGNLVPESERWSHLIGRVNISSFGCSE
jgi:hypothetical protein